MQERELPQYQHRNGFMMLKYISIDDEVAFLSKRGEHLGGSKAVIFAQRIKFTSAPGSSFTSAVPPMRHIAFLAPLLVALPAHAQTLYGMVIGVTDGDTVQGS